ncbi:MAG: glycosyltransferase family 2 protein [Chloroflexi bacterium]|nr:glycosyltransferase family 2 protein [Chloroflexota bacterium]OJV93155.1 MAG: glycosyltransferase [Chloroflexi bacterium 54-19]
MENSQEYIDTLSVIIPVYKSSNILGELITRLTKVLGHYTYEIILVNDGSPDNSWHTINELTRLYPNITGIDLMRNYGQHNALLCGIRNARYDVIVTLDDDLQHPPEEIPKLLTKLAEGYDVVYGTPVDDKHSFWRKRASQITKWALQGAMGAETARKVSAFRAFRTRLREAFVNYQSPFLSIDVLLTWGTTRFSSVRVSHAPRASGVSNYNFRKLVRHAFDMMTGFSTWPLQLASLIGFSFTLFGIIVFLYVIAVFFIRGGSVPGFPFLASIIAIFSGAQMFAIGIIGEYLARMHFRSMEKPTYTVREKTAAAKTPREEPELSDLNEPWAKLNK